MMTLTLRKQWSEAMTNFTERLGDPVADTFDKLGSRDTQGKLVESLPKGAGSVHLPQNCIEVIH